MLVEIEKTEHHLETTEVEDLDFRGFVFGLSREGRTGKCSNGTAVLRFSVAF